MAGAWRGWDWLPMGLVLLMLALTLYAGAVVLPAAHAARGILLLAESNYEVNFAPDSRVSQRVLFPSAPSQSNGIEDARFVHMKPPAGSVSRAAEPAMPAVAIFP